MIKGQPDPKADQHQSDLKEYHSWQQDASTGKQGVMGWWQGV